MVVEKYTALGGDCMTVLRSYLVPNADEIWRFYIYECDHCHREIDESWPHTDFEKEYPKLGLKRHLCWDCSFILEFISEEHYLRYTVGAIDCRASVRDGKVVIWTGKKPPWERTSRELRNSSEYREWRTAVFERDDYTCQLCGQRGGELNAHHMKPWAKYEELRFEVSNGLTLCEPCHINIHKKGDSNVGTSRMVEAP